MSKINTSMAIFISGILISLVIASKSFTPRYSIIADSRQKGAYIRLDNKTGETYIVSLSNVANCYQWIKYFP